MLRCVCERCTSLTLCLLHVFVRSMLCVCFFCSLAPQTCDA
jgi:hypothetical protein